MSKCGRGIEAGAESNRQLLVVASRERRDRGEDRDAEVALDVEDPDRSAETRVKIDNRPHVSVGNRLERDSRARDPVVPPEPNGVALDELEERSLERGVA